MMTVNCPLIPLECHWKQMGRNPKTFAKFEGWWSLLYLEIIRLLISYLGSMTFDISKFTGLRLCSKEFSVNTNET